MGLISQNDQRHPAVLKVILVQVGEADDYSTKIIANQLNNVGVGWLKFVSRNIAVSDIQEYELMKNIQIGNTAFWDAEKAVAILRASVPVSDDEIVIGITPGWLAFEKESPNPDLADAYLGVWSNKFIDFSESKYFLISTALWQSKYEIRSYRNVIQYITHMIVACIGDYIVERVDSPNENWAGMTHSVYQKCVFDYCPELDMIVANVQRSRICSRCQSRIENKKAELRISTQPASILDGFDRLLKVSRRPPAGKVFQALNDDPMFSILGLGIILSLFVGVVGNFVGRNLWVGVIAGLACALLLTCFWLLKRSRMHGRETA